ncbi:MAG: glycoside hydrolase family 73 protein [Bacilli bacterium]
MQPNEFLTTLGPAATQLYDAKGLYASVSLAQSALETGWLKFLPHDIHTGQNSYNIYGIKGVGPAGSVECYTREWQNGAYVTILAQFAAYHSYLESMEGHAQLLLTDSIYKPVLDAVTPYAACYALQDCGYATDPTYASQLVQLIQQNDLTKYDVKPQHAAPVQHYNVVVGWFDGDVQAKLAAERITKEFGYHATPQKA